MSGMSGNHREPVQHDLAKVEEALRFAGQSRDEGARAAFRRLAASGRALAAQIEQSGPNATHRGVIMQSNGWSIGVQSGGGAVRYYIAAIEDEALAVKAVAAEMAPGETILTPTPVEARLFGLRKVLPGEVRMLGRH